MFISAGLYFIIGVLHVKNVWLFVGLAFLAMIGMYFFQMQCWALVTDVIDDMEVKNHTRDDGTVYGMYSFARKDRSGNCGRTFRMGTWLDRL